MRDPPGPDGPREDGPDERAPPLPPAPDETGAPEEAPEEADDADADADDDDDVLIRYPADESTGSMEEMASWTEPKWSRMEK